MNIYVKQIIQFLLFLGVGLGILFLVYQNQSTAYANDCALKGIDSANCSLLQKVIADFGAVNYFWIFIAWLAFNFSNFSRAYRWKMLLNSMGHQPKVSNAFMAVLVGYFANLGLPRLGEIARAATISKYENIPVDQTVGTIVTDRVVDILSILIVTILAVLIEYQVIFDFFLSHVDFSHKISFLKLAVAIFAFLLVVFLVTKKFWNSKGKFALKLKKFAHGLKQGILSISKIKNPGIFILHSINIWLMYFFMAYLCFLAFEPTAHLSPKVALVVYVFGSWGVVIPSPGGMGTYHFLAQSALMLYGVSGDDGFSWANISFFSLQISASVLLGILSLILLPLLNKSYKNVPLEKY
jgi:glycosyltransferase 2 family protein